MPDDRTPPTSSGGTANAPPSCGAGDIFPNTRWSLVMAVGLSDERAASNAMEKICQDYWYPIYAYARRRGLSPHDAEDRTQEFFSSLISHETLRTVSPERGRLRAFFLTTMKNIIAKDYRRQSAEKRGGGAPVASIDQEMAERRLAAEPAHNLSPDVLFDQSWAYSVLDCAVRRLEEWYVRGGKADLFAAIRGFLASHQGEDSYREVAAKLGMNEPALRAAIHQMRKRYRAIIEDEVKQTVAGASEAGEELKLLQRVLAGQF